MTRTVVAADPADVAALDADEAVAALEAEEAVVALEAGVVAALDALVAGEDAADWTAEA